MKRSPLPLLLCVLALSGGVALGGLNLWFGELNHDEGWYLYAAQSVSKGLKPYTDFAFTQAPVLPYVYALAAPLWDPQGVAGGRAFTLFLGLAGIVLGGLLARRLTRDPVHVGAASAAAMLLLGGNVYHSYFTTVVKTYSLCGLFVLASLLALLRGVRTRSIVWTLIAGVLAVLAAGTRISAGAIVPVMLVWLIWNQGRTNLRLILAFAAGLAVAAGVVFLRFAIEAPEQLRFGLLEYHAGRDAGSLSDIAKTKIGFLSRVTQGYLIAILLGVMLPVLRRPKVAPQPAVEFLRSPAILLWGCVAAVTALHLSAPFPYDDYQVIIAPVFCAAVAAAWVNLVGAADVRLMPRFLIVLLLAVGAAALSSPMLQAWVVRGRDRIWWRFKEKTDLQQLRETAREVRSKALALHGGADAKLLTQDTYLAVEAHLRVPPGFEMGPFSYYPQFDSQRAARLKVLNRERLLEAIDQAGDWPIAALSGYSFAIASPGITEVPDAERDAILDRFRSRYSAVSRCEHFGQGGTPLEILVLKDGSTR